MTDQSEDRNTALITAAALAKKERDVKEADMEIVGDAIC